MVQATSSLSFVTQSSQQPTFQTLSLGTRIWNKIDLKFGNWRENFLSAIAVSQFVLSCVFLLYGWWVTSLIALVTAGFCSATRKKIQEFTDLHNVIDDHKDITRLQRHIARQQEQLARNFQQNNVRLEQSNVRLEQNNARLEQSNVRLESTCIDLEEKLHDFRKEIDHLRKQAEKFKLENTQYSEHNTRHAALLKCFSSQTDALEQSLAQALRQGNAVSRKSLQELQALLSSIKKGKEAFAKISTEVEQKNDAALKRFEKLANQLEKTDDRKLSLLVDSEKKLAETESKVAAATEKLQILVEQVSLLEEQLAELKKLVPTFAAAAKNNLETSRLVQSTFTRLFGWLVSGSQTQPCGPAARGTTSFGAQQPQIRV